MLSHSNGVVVHAVQPFPFPCFRTLQASAEASTANLSIVLNVENERGVTGFPNKVSRFFERHQPTEGFLIKQFASTEIPAAAGKFKFQEVLKANIFWANIWRYEAMSAAESSFLLSCLLLPYIYTEQ